MRTALIVAAVVLPLHFAMSVATLVFGSTLSLSDFDTGPSLAGELGDAIFWIHANLLAQPFKPLERNEAPWSWGRGYAGLFINSLTWAILGGVGGTVVGRRQALAARDNKQMQLTRSAMANESRGPRS